MTALHIEEIGSFTRKLFVGDTFDRFWLREASIVTYNTFTIDGHIHQSYYTSEEREEQNIGAMSYWAAVRPVCFSLIKGKKLPGSFHIILQLSPKQVEDFLQNSGVGLLPEQIGGIYLNIRYEDQVLSCVSGISLNVFTMDKTADHAWDEALKQFLKAQEIIFTEE